jgi:hypothetical protein
MRVLSKALIRSILLSSATSLAFLKTTYVIVNVYGFFIATRKLLNSLLLFNSIEKRMSLLSNVESSYS